MPAIEYTIKTYSELRHELEDPGALLVIWGKPGLGKTQLVSECLSGIALFFESRFTPGQLDELIEETEAWEKPPLIVLDDFWEKRHLPSVVEALDQGRQFVLVTNIWQKTNPYIEAVGSRGVVVRFEPSAKEVHLEVARGKWFHDQEVYDFFYENLSAVQQPDMRQYSTLAECKAKGKDWRAMFRETHGQQQQPQLVISRYLAMEGLNMNQRAKAFAKDGHGTERTFWRQMKKFVANHSKQDFENPRLPPKPKPRVKSHKGRITVTSG